MFTTKIERLISGISPLNAISERVRRCSSYTSHARDLDDRVAGSVAPNTVGYTAGSPLLLYPDMGLVQIETNGGRSNYNGLTAAVTRILPRSQFQSSYAFVGIYLTLRATTQRLRQ
jgi:hypothetical protein